MIDRDARAIRRVLIVEGAGNLILAITELSVGLVTGSLALVSDSLHSATDVANNVLAWFAMRIALRPPDDGHPYGHGKFESLAVFALGTLMSVLAVETLLGVIRHTGEADVATSGVGLVAVCIVMVLQLCLAAWQQGQARRLDSDLLHADAAHTLGDTATTFAAIVGWQIAARGYVWIDRALAVVVAGLVLVLAYRLFRRAIPILADSAAIRSEDMDAVIAGVEGVEGVRRARSRWDGNRHIADVTILVAADLEATVAHEITRQVEHQLATELGIEDVVVHVEPAR